MKIVHRHLFRTVIGLRATKSENPGQNPAIFLGAQLFFFVLILELYYLITHKTADWKMYQELASVSFCGFTSLTLYHWTDQRLAKNCRTM